jgi:hypothetical protein
MLLNMVSIMGLILMPISVIGVHIAVAPCVTSMAG